MTEFTTEELDGQHGEILPAREELLVGAVISTVGRTVAATQVVATTQVVGKTVVVAVV